MPLLHRPLLPRAATASAVWLWASCVFAAPGFAQTAAAPDAIEALLQQRGLSGSARTAAPALRADGAATAADAPRSTTSNPMGQVALYAMGFIGAPYARGGNSYESGFDCSGFVKAIYEQTVARLLPRTSAQQAEQTRQIDRTELQPGDLVFFNTLKRAFSHVGIYIGDGKFVHSPRSGSTVRVEHMHQPYWSQRFNGARRVD